MCWDADLRRVGHQWLSYRMNGSSWKQDRLINVALNSYRVLLTRARKGMVIFLPTGDLSTEDITRRPTYYDGIGDFLVSCGARLMGEDA